ncbi:hypothetical protein O181_031334 [Austropuccinia psidii MF-1]|uniref:Uncharacterized protein n=1 Tax=Austropuccinia psidii MF-1 TaxID=1389203 RepID=A0A9Q3H6F5_9BASI|nr:hypothetical protein [Austropuccinia psidii MF-1]
MLTKLPGCLEHEVTCRCLKEFTLDEISNTLQEVSIRTYIGRYSTHSTGDNWENPTLEEKEAQDSEDEMKNACHNCGSPNKYAENFSKDREEILSRKEETRKD